MSHFDELDYLRYLDEELPTTRMEAIEAHLRGCPLCREVVEALERETALLRESLIEIDDAVPARAPAAWEEMSWAFVLVIGLAGLGLYMLWSWFVVPWLDRLQMVGMDYETLVAVVVFKTALWEGWSVMGKNMIQGGTILMSALAVISILRWGWHRTRLQSLLIMGLVGLVSAPPSIEAAVIQIDVDKYVLEAGEVVENDLIVVGETIRIEGRVEGDVIAAGQSLTVSGHVAGDVLAFCQRVQIEGQVDGSVRSGSQFLDLNGRVGRNVSSGAETVEIQPGAVVGGGLILGAQRVTLDGRAGRDLIVGAEEQHLNGAVGGSALMAGSRLTIGRGAQIQGEAKFFGAEPPEVSPDARLAVPLEVEIREAAPEYVKVENYVKALLKWAAAFVFGLVGILAVPGPYRKVVDSSTRYGISILTGAGAVFIVPFAALVVSLTLVGLPVGLTALFAYLAALYGAQVIVGSWLGREILGAPSTQGQALGQLAVGLALIHFVRHVPYVGWLVSAVVTLWGMGALILAVTRRVAPAPATA